MLKDTYYAIYMLKIKLFCYYDLSAVFLNQNVKRASHSVPTVYYISYITRCPQFIIQQLRYFFIFSTRLHESYASTNLKIDIPNINLYVFSLGSRKLTQKLSYINNNIQKTQVIYR